ncbi:MAG TPA: efflux transporter periplasmic adaptor subunit, partial [Nitrosomonas nitrosa]|nr:efflux transporter periplasmic adaptor subunit [Nitrosomonas nitrosa]
MNATSLKPIILVIIVGIILGGLILNLEKASFSEEAEHTASGTDIDDDDMGEETGPEGGKIFTTDNFSIEVTIFEKGVEPQFRLYLYKDGKPIPPADAKVAITLSRLGSPAQLFSFSPVGDYLLGDQVVEEPHSFDAAIAVEWRGKV